MHEPFSRIIHVPRIRVLLSHGALIRMHASDNLAIVANDGGPPAGTNLDGLTLIDAVPQAHKVR